MCHDEKLYEKEKQRKWAKSIVYFLNKLNDNKEICSGCSRAFVLLDECGAHINVLQLSTHRLSFSPFSVCVCAVERNEKI